MSRVSVFVHENILTLVPFAAEQSHIILVPLPPPSAISPVSLPAVREACPSTSSWQSSKHFPASCLMMLNRAVDTYHSLPVTLSETLFEGTFLQFVGEIGTVACFGNTAIAKNVMISR